MFDHGVKDSQLLGLDRHVCPATPTQRLPQLGQLDDKYPCKHEAGERDAVLGCRADCDESTRAGW
jgi:hypothetical protein